MSYDKAAQPKRHHNDQKALARQLRIFYYHNDKGTEVTAVQQGRMVKHHALNCGRSGCYLCTNPRRFGQVSLAERKADLH